jgi:type I restriction enzyme S subunit
MDGVNGSALQEIPLGNLRNVHIPVPLKEEQARLADRLDAMEHSKAQSEKKLGIYQNLKKGLMQDLLTGKVRVKIEEKEKESAAA